MAPDHTTREPSLLSGAVYSLAAGVHIIGTVQLLGVLLNGYGAGLVLGVQVGVGVALALVAGEVAGPVLRWFGRPLRGGRDAA